ncbi:MAG: hypothetical protein ACJ787_21205 [Myxococcales bacterium]
MSIWAPKLSCEPLLLICGANPKWAPRSKPSSCPFTSKVTNAGKSPVLTRVTFSCGTRPPEMPSGALGALGVAAESGPTVSTVPLVYTPNAFTFPATVKLHPFPICIVN